MSSNCHREINFTAQNQSPFKWTLATREGFYLNRAHTWIQQRPELTQLQNYFILEA